LRDKFRMQHSEGSVNTADGHANSIGGDSARKQDHDVLSPATTEHINSEEIRPLDRSPQRGAVVRVRRNSGSKNTANTASPSQINAAADDGKRSAEVIIGSCEKVVSGHTVTRSPPVQVVDDNGTVAVDHSSVTSPGSERAGLTQSGRSRASGHVSDVGSRQDATNDRYSQKSASASAVRRGGYVSDTSFSAGVAGESARNAAAEGMSYQTAS